MITFDGFSHRQDLLDRVLGLSVSALEFVDQTFDFNIFCPVDCFREGPNFLVIDPDECIDCAVCVPECPVNAIYAEDDVPSDQQAFIKLNADLSAGWDSITKSKAGLPDADEWKDVKNKLDQLVK